MNDDATNERELTDPERETVDAICAEHDFPFQQAVIRGEILKLTPRTLDDLPNSEQMGIIADALEDEGFRYVTFAVPEAPADAAAPEDETP